MKTLIVITGPTGVGKTSISIQIAEKYDTEIISADSRQLYRDIPIGTAAPTAEQTARVKHHFVATMSLEEYYSAAQFEEDALAQLDKIFTTHDYAVMCGGSMLYVDAICKGIDSIPTISEDVRSRVLNIYTQEGIEAVKAQLSLLDSEYYSIVDLNNHKRVIHALEICLQSGRSYTSLRTGEKKIRPFRIVKIALTLPREELFERINYRVEEMLVQGLEEEARRVYPLRHLNSLNTVGFKEMFAYLDGTMDYITAKERIKKNTRVYAKKQLTWYAKDDTIIWCRPILSDVEASISKAMLKP
ncbi:MAG: tRNA (adenosine(37)-N6)-dimethylallyltransferase MiaA [Muribaculaceae bacterium]|nr:tRNA (adenosine(37)-N6)-dimethylallyltransferase MiaA [Muribaculaceae bacterium]